MAYTFAEIGSDAGEDEIPTEIDDVEMEMEVKKRGKGKGKEVCTVIRD